MRPSIPPWLRFLLLALASALPLLASAQSGDKPFNKEGLDQLTAQIALYPDPLLSQVLTASTCPADVAEAARWSRVHAEQKGDDGVEMVANEPGDPSVQSPVAWPVKWRDPGVTTFIVDKAGNVHQNDLGPGSDRLARAMTAYDLDSSWTGVPSSH